MSDKIQEIYARGDAQRRLEQDRSENKLNLLQEKHSNSEKLSDYKSKIKIEEIEHKAEISSQKSKELSEFKNVLSKEKYEELKLDKIQTQSEATLLENELLPFNLEQQYLHHVKTSNIDIQAFEYRERVQFIHERQAESHRANLKKQEIYASLKALVIEEEIRRISDENRHRQAMEMARLQNDLEVDAFHRKHELLLKLQQQYGQEGVEKFEQMIKELEATAPSEALKTAKPKDPLEPR